VVETAEKIAEDVAEAFPENKSLKKAASRIKAITYEVEEDANKAEAILHKVRSIAY
jgi:polysaccharide pyruvyl transferase WcaK-like protein